MALVQFVWFLLDSHFHHSFRSTSAVTRHHGNSTYKAKITCYIEKSVKMCEKYPKNANFVPKMSDTEPDKCSDQAFKIFQILNLFSSFN